MHSDFFLHLVKEDKLLSFLEYATKVFKGNVSEGLRRPLNSIFIWDTTREGYDCWHSINYKDTTSPSLNTFDIEYIEINYPELFI